VVTLPSIAEMAVKPVTEPAPFRLLAELQSPAMDPAQVQKAIHAWARCLATAAPSMMYHALGHVSHELTPNRYGYCGSSSA
jgi:hypothetical protein